MLAFSHLNSMVDPGAQRPPLLVAEALGNIVIPAELSAILVDRFWMVWEDGAALPSEKHLGQGIHSFLVHIFRGWTIFLAWSG